MDEFGLAGKVVWGGDGEGICGGFDGLGDVGTGEGGFGCYFTGRRGKQGERREKKVETEKLYVGKEGSPGLRLVIFRGNVTEIISVFP